MYFNTKECWVCFTPSSSKLVACTDSFKKLSQKFFRGGLVLLNSTLGKCQEYKNAPDLGQPHGLILGREKEQIQR